MDVCSLKFMCHLECTHRNVGSMSTSVAASAGMAKSPRLARERSFIVIGKILIKFGLCMIWVKI